MPAKGGRYHHGDLRSALIDAAIDVIAERGVRGFSLAETSRRLGVTTAAPYRHFTDRDELLATVTARALTEFSAMLAEASDSATTPAQRLAAIAGAYVRFAAQRRALFDTIFSSGLDKSRYPALQHAWEPVDTLLTVVLEVCDGDAAAADALADAVEASAHGYAMLLVDGDGLDGDGLDGTGLDGDGLDGAVEEAAAKAVASAQALIAGRHALRPG
jgi:AcrR family transcriptional regulator